MSHTLFDATAELSRALKETYDGKTTTTGTTTQATDTRQPFGDGDMVGGTLWAPIVSESVYVSAHLSNVFTFDAISTALEDGGAYKIAGPRYPRYVLIQAINEALSEIGEIENETILTADGGREYGSGDNAVYALPIVKLFVSPQTADPYDWQPNDHYDQIKDGSDMFLVFHNGFEPVSGYSIRVVYRAVHAAVSEDSDVISPSIKPERLKWQAAVHALRWRKMKTRNDESDTLDQQVQEADRNALLAINRYPVRSSRPVKPSSW